MKQQAAVGNITAVAAYLPATMFVARNARLSAAALAGWILLAPVPRTFAAERELVPDGYQLVWSDEFDGDKVDDEHWHLRTTTRRGVSICLPRNVSLVDGKARIALKREQHEGCPLTCGGLITRRKFRYGYYQTAARLDPGSGWHEAFWTANIHDFHTTDPALRNEARIEIDIFEHFAKHDPHTFSYGIIEWNPVHGSLCRSTPKVPENLAARFNTWAFEFTPDYLNFFFNGRLLETADVSVVAHNEFHIWLSAIGTEVAGTTDGECFFDYLRCYAIDLESPAYARRKAVFSKILEKMRNPDRGPAASGGRDLWIECEDFRQAGGWEVARDGYQMILAGRQGDKLPPEDPRLTAGTRIRIPEPGRHRLWVRSKDYASNSPGSRKFRVAVDGRPSSCEFGTHRSEGFAWQDGGVFNLANDTASLELRDSSQYYARADRLLLTSDLDFVPSGVGGPANAEHR